MADEEELTEAEKRIKETFSSSHTEEGAFSKVVLSRRGKVLKEE